MIHPAISNYFHSNGILVLALLIILGLIFANIAKIIQLPKITGYIFAGIVIGDPLLHLISPESQGNLNSFNLIALGLMSITIGAHLNFFKLKLSGRRILFVFFFESLFTFIFVYLALHYIAGKENLLALLIASISIATAPAATVATVKEVKAKGLLVNTLMPVVALNNVLCILVFGIISDIISKGASFQVNDLLFIFGEDILLSIILGVVAGYILKYSAERSISSGAHVLTFVLLTVFATTGISIALEINSMLPCMVIGIVITNTSQFKSKILTIFEEIEYLILIVFFALAGAHIDLHSLGLAGLVGIVYFFARVAGKVSGATIGARLAKAPQRVYYYVGATLLPQAGVAIGLVIMARSIPALADISDFLTTLVLAVVALSEIVGPPITKWALSQSGDAGQDRPKLIEFFMEEYINPNLKATTRDEAIEELVDFFIKTHNGTKKQRREILESVLQRENEASTGVGRGIAIPHGLVKRGPVIWGAIGLSRTGIDFDSIDGEPVRLIILIVTPQNHKDDMHLAVLSQLAKILEDENTTQRIFMSKTGAEISDILTETEKKDFNYFLD